MWEKATIVSGAPGGRVEVDAGGADYVKFLAPQFKQNDGVDYGVIGFGIVTIGEADGGGGGDGPELMDSQYIPALG